MLIALELVPLIFAWYLYRHQSSALRFTTIQTESNKAVNRGAVRVALHELGWPATIEDGDYLEAVVPFGGSLTLYSQLVVILILDRKILITSISQPDVPAVQGGLSFGKNKRNIDRFSRVFLAIDADAMDPAACRDPSA